MKDGGGGHRGACAHDPKRKACGREVPIWARVKSLLKVFFTFVVSKKKKKKKKNRLCARLPEEA